MKNICFEAIKNGGKLECSRLEQWCVIHFLVAEKCKLSEIYKRMCDVLREANFNKKKMFTNGLNMSSPLECDSKRQSMECRNTLTLG